MKLDKKAFTLLELVLVILLSSILIITTIKYIKEINLTQYKNREISILKIDLNSTKILIEKNLPQIVSKLKYLNNTLYIEDNILLKNVTDFAIHNTSNILYLDIELKNSISQSWRFKL